MHEWQVHSEAELAPIITTVLDSCNNDLTTGTVVLALSGDLGAGKTTFTKYLATALGVTDTVTSPTFVIMKRYATNDERFAELVHMDAYRIDAVDELRPLHFDELLKTPNTLLVIEWPERIAGALPEHLYTLNFAIEGENRRLTFSYD